MVLSGNASALILAILFCFAIYKAVIYPKYISSLSRIPNAHWSSPISPLWILSVRYQQRSNRTIHEAHERLGPVVRLGPSEVSVNCVKDGIQTIYSGGFDKHSWYSNVFANFGGVHNMFSTTGSKAHSNRKRMLSNVYSKSFIHKSPTMLAISRDILSGRLLPILDKAASESKHVDAFRLFTASTMDFVTAYIFGSINGTRYLSDLENWNRFLNLYMFRRDFLFWPQEMPRFTALASKVGINLVPQSVSTANGSIEEIAMEMVRNALGTLNDERCNRTSISEANFPVVLSQLYSAFEKQSLPNYAEDGKTRAEPRESEIASELLDHLAAGFETSGITLTYVAYELSRDQTMQTKLRQELRSIQGLSKTSPPDPTQLDKLPLLHAILQETLRLHTAIPGGQPRLTPAKGCSIAGFHDLPAGVRIESQAFSLHRNPEIFPQPNSWKPDRWLDENGNFTNGGEMARWWWAFSSGGRMCIGSNLAMYQMKCIVAAIWSRFSTQVVCDTGIEQVDGYTAPPRSESLMLEFLAET